MNPVIKKILRPVAHSLFMLIDDEYRKDSLWKAENKKRKDKWIKEVTKGRQK